MRHNSGFSGLGRALAGTLLLSLGACGETPSPAPSPASPSNADVSKPAAETPTATAPEPDAVYVVRGRVTMIPDPANPTTEFRVRHEPIPTFKSPNGQVVGMNEMDMPFPVADTALLDGVGVGDLVEITFADWYKPLRTYKVTKLTRLPADTKLNISDD